MPNTARACGGMLARKVCQESEPTTPAQENAKGVRDSLFRALGAALVQLLDADTFNGSNAGSVLQPILCARKRAGLVKALLECRFPEVRSVGMQSQNL